MNTPKEAINVVMLGATGAVGNHVARTLATMSTTNRLTLLGRREAPGLDDAGGHARVAQHQVDVLTQKSYVELLPGHDCAICCLGVGQPSKMSREQFTQIDKTAPLEFAAACRAAGVQHFELLSSIGVSAQSRSFYLKSKGELEDGLRALEFERLSLFHPSMILTPSNRYGFNQALTLALWPKLTPLLCGKLRKLRGIEVERLGAAMARNLVTPGRGEETLEWDAIRQRAGDE